MAKLNYKGDIKKALGSYTIKLKQGIEIEIETVTPENMIEYTNIISTIDTLAPEMRIGRYTEYFVKYFKKELPDLSDNELNNLIVLNIGDLIQEFMIMYRIIDRDKLKEVVAQSVEEMKSIKDEKSPIVK